MLHSTLVIDLTQLQHRPTFLYIFVPPVKDQLSYKTTLEGT